MTLLERLEVEMRDRLDAIEAEATRLRAALEVVRPAPRIARAYPPRRVPRGVNRGLIREALRGCDGRSLAELAERTGIVKATLSTTLSQMKRAGEIDSHGGVWFA